MARLDNLDYEVNGVTTNYEIVPEIAPLFNATTAYAAGDTVIKEGHLYRFNTAHAAGAWIGTDADEITVGEELTAHDADIVQIKNLQAPAILSDTYSGTTLSTINVNIPAGTYTLEVESLTSADVDTELSLVTFVYSGGSLSVRLPRERNIKKKVTFKGNVTTMYLYASDSYAHSVGDAFSFTGLKLITGYPLKDEVDDLSQTVQGLSGRYTTYEAGGRTFTDNTLAYIGANNTIVLGNTNDYAVYTYNITEPTSFVVTGSTRGASNYIAIATDDSGKCVQTIEQGASATTKSYSNFEFTIDDFEATTVYICLYKQPTDEVLIKLNKDVKELSILFVGNSLTQDGIAYLPYLLTRYYPEFRFRFYMWYNGGYDLSQQYAKFTADTECESFSIAEGTPAWTNTTAKMSDVLSTYRFNIVCMQEYFNRKASYTDADLTDWNNCHDYIVSHYTGGNALEFISLFHSPWLTDEQSVYDLTKTGNALILKKTVADDMIATGIALHMARSTALDSLGDQGHLTPDSVHAQEGLPCLLETYTALLWVLDRYGFPTTIYGLPFKMTAGIQSSIAVPGANIGTGVIEGTDAQNLLAQEVAVMAYKVGKKFVVDNLTADDELTKLKADFTQVTDILAGSESVNLGYEIAGTSHYIVASTGAVFSESLANWSYTDYVDVSMYSAIEYKRSTHTIATPAVGMAFYDDTKTYISGIAGYGSKSGLGYELFTTPVPNGAKYARFSALVDAQTYGAFAVGGKSALVISGYSVKPPTYKNEYYWNVEGDTAVLTSISGGYWRAYDPVDVLPGETYSVTAAQGSTHKTRCWIVVDDNNTILLKDDDYFDSGDTQHTTQFTVPDNGTKLLLCARFAVTPIITIYKILNQSVSYAKDQSLNEYEKSVARNNIDAADRSELSFTERITSFTLSALSFWNVETNVAVYTSLPNSNWMASTVVPVHEGEVYTVSGTQGSTHKTRIWAVTDDSMNILDMAEDYYGNENWHTETFTVPTGGTKLVMTTRSNVGSPYIYLYKQSTLKDAVLGKMLSGKTVAVLGDSISTNGNTGDDANVPEITVTADDVGVELSAYLTYYDVQAGLSLGGHTYTSDEIGTEVTFTPVEEDVGKSIGLPNNYNPNTTTVWWEVMQNKLGNKTIPVCWSGSSITSHEASQASRKTAHAWHTAQIRKCGIRTPGTMQRTAPDIIIIYRGTNDFSHGPYTLLTDNYFDGYNWEYPTDDTVTGGYGFKEGLCLTVKKLREAYPNAQIWLCTLNVFKRINYSHFPTNNGIDSLPQYNDAIREVAHFLGCNVIEFDKDGITFENCYSGGYITDSETIPTHPTDKGHYIMGQKAIADMKAKYNELI